jgi:uncharacterized membrane protein YeaQ/YmgE (transglycosylase-associated protein family)
MDPTALIIFLAIGAIAGWLAGLIMKDPSSSLVRNMIVGVLGSIIGGFLFDLLGLSAGGLIGSIVMATAGAAVLLFVLNKLKA